MLYTHKNVVPGTRVTEEETGVEIRRVVSVDTDDCIVEIAPEFSGITIKVHYDLIIPGVDSRLMPNAFRCYGVPTLAS